MSLGEHQTFESELKAELRDAGLPTNPRQVVGRHYRFGCEHGSHNHIFVGTIQAIEVSDEGGLDLYVSNPRFRGGRLISIKRSNGRWVAYVDIKPHEGELFEGSYFEGEFRLL